MEVNGGIQTLAIKLAHKYFQYKKEYIGNKDLYAQVIYETPKMWKCYVSNKELDDYGEHIIIDYTIKTGEAFIQFYTLCDDDILFIWIDTGKPDEVAEITVL